MRRPERRTLIVAGGAFALALPLALILLPGENPDKAAARPVLPSRRRSPELRLLPPAAVGGGAQLHGLLGRGAILALADGRRRFFAIGREVAPGLTVARIERQAVILASAGGARLGFDGAAYPDGAGARRRRGDGRGPAARPNPQLPDRPRGAPGRRTAGFVVRPGISMPALERAGLRPGDLILSVNGSRFDEERMLELAWEMANASRTEFEIERGGRRMRLAHQ